MMNRMKQTGSHTQTKTDKEYEKERGRKREREKKTKREVLMASESPKSYKKDFVP